MEVSAPHLGQNHSTLQLDRLLREGHQWLRELGDCRRDVDDRAPLAENCHRTSWAEPRYGRLPGLRAADFSCSCLRHSAQSLPDIEQRLMSFGAIS